MTIKNKIFMVQIYLEPRRKNMSKKSMEQILNNVLTGMNRQYKDEIKKSSSIKLFEYPAENFIIRGKEN